MENSKQPLPRRLPRVCLRQQRQRRRRCQGKEFVCRLMKSYETVIKEKSEAFCVRFLFSVRVWFILLVYPSCVICMHNSSLRIHRQVVFSASRTVFFPLFSWWTFMNMSSFLYNYIYQFFFLLFSLSLQLYASVSVHDGLCLFILPSLYLSSCFCMSVCPSFLSAFVPVFLYL